MLFTMRSQLNGQQMAAATVMSDSTTRELTALARWSLLEVVLDDAGKETGTKAVPASKASISQPLNGAAGGVLTVADGAGTPPMRLRIVATDTVSSKSGKSDLQLQF